MVRLILQCPECHRQTEVALGGRRAVVEVEHDCDGESAFVVRVAEAEESEQLRMAAA